MELIDFKIADVVYTWFKTCYKQEIGFKSLSFVLG